MHLIDLLALLVVLSALFGYLNHRWLQLPTTIGLMALSLGMSLLLIAVGHWWPGGREAAAAMLRGIDFDTFLLQGMLSFLLFAGALHVNLDDLYKQRWVVSVLATVGVLLSTVLVGLLTWWVLGLLGIGIPLIYCLLFGALISPTDPIAVLGILKTANAPKSLEIKIAGESLFNDGVGVVVFVILLGVASGGHEATVGGVAMLLVEEALGGIVLGLLLGWVTFVLLRSVDEYKVEVMLTLALTMGGYSLATALHTSGPIAIVVAGLFIGNHGRALAMSDTTRENLDRCWELMDEALNGVLFVLIGLEMLLVAVTSAHLLAVALLIPAVLLARWISVGIPIGLMGRWRRFTPKAVQVLTWGGLRGGISVALALSLPPGPERDTILAITYGIVVFSILVQGLTVGRLVRSIPGSPVDLPLARH